MKLLIAFCAVCALVQAWSPPTEAESKKQRDECFVSENIPKESQDMLNKGLFPTHPGCYYRCTGLKSDIWDDVNGYSVDRSYDLLTAEGWEVTKASLRKCNTPDKKNADPCVWSSAIAKCLWDNDLIKRKA
ncbi:unnamed protein product [Hermetia illucens]|uniref:Uncharacterized protein n=1 Tax=Hermetia illucens TaxID=343691 RepID=A0A7R8UUB4_HERIL|nr:uncharacterized protein LOC119654537 [Hermetia illucens]CAD7087209.1 unnamed protein product [Hermetia illucens]